MQTAKFVMEIMVKDPDTKGKVTLEVYKAESGGIFAVDSSFLEQFELGEILILNPFADVGGIEDDNLALVIKLQE
jgi:hypothetical protein